MHRLIAPSVEFAHEPGDPLHLQANVANQVIGAAVADVIGRLDRRVTRMRRSVVFMRTF